jgi:hypothetical protein
VAEKVWQHRPSVELRPNVGHRAFPSTGLMPGAKVVRCGTEFSPLASRLRASGIVRRYAATRSLCKINWPMTFAFPSRTAPCNWPSLMHFATSSRMRMTFISIAAGSFSGERLVVLNLRLNIRCFSMGHRLYHIGPKRLGIVSGTALCTPLDLIILVRHMFPSLASKSSVPTMRHGRRHRSVANAMPNPARKWRSSTPPVIRIERLQRRQRRRRLRQRRHPRCLQPQQPYSCDAFGKAAIASRNGVVELFLDVVVLHGLPPVLDGVVGLPAFFPP